VTPGQKLGLQREQVFGDKALDGRAGNRTESANAPASQLRFLLKYS
jgi:hypothetical protein